MVVDRSTADEASDGIPDLDSLSFDVAPHLHDVTGEVASGRVSILERPSMNMLPIGAGSSQKVNVWLIRGIAQTR